MLVFCIYIFLEDDNPSLPIKNLPVTSFPSQLVTDITKLAYSVADPDSGSGIQCRFDPWIREPGWVKSQDPDPG